MGLNVSKAAAGAVLALGLVGGAEAATLPIFTTDDFVEDVPVTGITAIDALAFPIDSTDMYMDTFTVAAGVDVVAIEYEPIFPDGTGDFGLTSLTITIGALTQTVGDGLSFIGNGSLLFDVVQGVDANAITIAATSGSAGGGLQFDVAAVPIPAAGLLFGGALLGAGLLRRNRIREEVGLPEAS